MRVGLLVCVTVKEGVAVVVCVVVVDELVVPVVVALRVRVGL